MFCPTLNCMSRKYRSYIEQFTKSEPVILNPVPDYSILALSKLKAFADDHIYKAQMVQFLAENIVGKGENAGYLQGVV